MRSARTGLALPSGPRLSESEADTMRSDLDHLPERQQQELERVRDILLAEFESAIRPATQPHKRDGKVYKIILFGSYARSDWVD